MSRSGRRLRRVVNPVSTRLSEAWCSSVLRRTLLRREGRRRHPARRRPSPTGPRPGDPARSPGPWTAPSGVLPGWDWLPAEHGAQPRLDRVPPWVRLWYRTPLIDRYAHVWMWHHGGWDVLPHHGPGPGGPRGVREPRRPPPRAPAARR